MRHLITFGGLRIDAQGGGSALGSARNRLLCLAIIAAHRGIRRDRLAAMLWPDADEERGRSSLRQALFVIRRELDGADVTVGTTELRLNPAVLDSDVGAFRVSLADGRLQDAVQLYQGPFLHGVNVRNTPELERWIEDERASLAGAFARALQTLAEGALARGDAATAVGWWTRAAAHDRFSARIARALMEAQVAAGDREAAIRQAAQYARIVREELEVEPDASLMAYASSLRAAPRVAAPAPAATPAAPSTVPLVAQPVGDEADASDLPPAAPTPDTTADTPAVRLTGTVAAPPVRRTRVRAEPALLVMLGGLAALAFVTLRRTDDRSSGTIGAVAVAPIQNLTRDSALDVVAGIATTRIREHLIGSTGVPVLDPARLTGAATETLLRGVLHRDGDSLLVTIELVNARDGRVLLAAGPVVGTAGAADRLYIELQQRVSGAVAALTDSVYLPWRTAGSRPPRYAAFQAFHAALAAMADEPLDVAMPYLRRAMELDPDFVEAKIWFIETADALGWDRAVIDSVSRIALAQRDRLGIYDQLALDRQLAFLDGRTEEVYFTARRMRTVAPRTPDAYLHLVNAAMATNRYRAANEAFHAGRALGGWGRSTINMRSWDLQAHRHRGDLATAVAEWKADRTRAPLHNTSCIDGIRVLANAGDEAAVDTLIAECGRVVRSMGPADRMYEIAGRQYRSGGHADEARRAFERALVLRTAGARANEAGSARGLAALHCELGNWRIAYDLLRHAPANVQRDARVTMAILAAHVGDTAQSNALLGRLERLSPSSRRGEMAMERAFIVLAQGRRDEAVQLLTEAVAGGISPAWTAWYARWELLPLRGDARFEALLRSRD